MPKPQNLGIFAIRNTSLVIYSIGVGFAFLIFLQLSRNVWLAAVLAAFVLFSPQMLNIDFLRVDHVLMGLYLVTLLLTLTIGRSNRPQHPIMHGLYAATTASLCLTKISSILFLAFPVAVYIRRIRVLGINSSRLLWFCICFALFAAFLLVRLIPHEIASPRIDIADSVCNGVGCSAMESVFYQISASVLQHRSISELRTSFFILRRRGCLMDHFSTIATGKVVCRHVPSWRFGNPERFRNPFIQVRTWTICPCASFI